MRKRIQYSSTRTLSRGRSVILNIIIGLALLIGVFYALMFLLSAGILINLFFIQPVRVTGQAMAPNYSNGMYLMTRVVHQNNIAFKRGDVIVFAKPGQPEIKTIKRIIGLPDETIMIESGNISIDGQKLDERAYLSPDTQTYAGAFLKEGETITIPAEQYFVLGDNRTKSSDSREWGLVPLADIRNVTAFCYWNCGNK